MADNIRLNPGVAGDLIAADEVSAKKYQIVKVAWGADGTATDITAENRLPVVTEDSIHLRIHQGTMYAAGYHDMAVADNASIELLIQIDASLHAHTLMSVAVGGDSEAYLFEGTTFSNAGTSITPTNKNRTSANVASTTVSHSPTLTLDGTQIAAGLIPGGTKAQSGGGTGSSFAEWLLENSETYLIRLTNRAGNSQPLGIVIDFYEAT